MAGRIETYVHSDSITQNKGAAAIKVGCQTDFAARTDQFIDFAKEAARFAYATGAAKWSDIVALFPDLETRRADVSKALKETVSVDEIQILKL